MEIHKTRRTSLLSSVLTESKIQCNSRVQEIPLPSFDPSVLEPDGVFAAGNLFRRLGIIIYRAFTVCTALCQILRRKQKKSFLLRNIELLSWEENNVTLICDSCSISPLRLEQRDHYPEFPTERVLPGGLTPHSHLPPSVQDLGADGQGSNARIPSTLA